MFLTAYITESFNLSVFLNTTWKEACQSASIFARSQTIRWQILDMVLSECVYKCIVAGMCVCLHLKSGNPFLKRTTYQEKTNRKTTERWWILVR